jgi:peptidoglycan/LPS O-acetylase OafA/YrhL
VKTSPAPILEPETSILVSSAKQRYEGLDQLRGILAFSVMVYHYAEWQKIQLPWLFHQPLSLIGVYAVGTFYTLSGFALYVVYRERKISRIFLLEFWIKRICRIVPLFWLVSTITLLITKVPAVLWSEHIDVQMILLNYSLLFSWFDPSAYLATGAWSIGNEWAFYTLFPLMLLASRFRSGQWITGVAVLVVTCWFTFVAMDANTSLENQWVTYIHPLNQLILFAAGVLFGPTIIKSTCRKTFPVQVSVATALFVAASYFSDISHWVSGFGRLAMVAICVICCQGFAITRLEHGWTPRILTFLGSISYTMYLMHPIAHHCVNKVLGKIQSLTGKTTFGDQLLDVLSFVGSIAATLVISAIIYRFLEKPFIALGKRLARRHDVPIAG